MRICPGTSAYMLHISLDDAPPTRHFTLPRSAGPSQVSKQRVCMPQPARKHNFACEAIRAANVNLARCLPPTCIEASCRCTLSLSKRLYFGVHTPEIGTTEAWLSKLSSVIDRLATSRLLGRLVIHFLLCSLIKRIFVLGHTILLILRSGEALAMAVRNVVSGVGGQIPD